MLDNDLPSSHIANWDEVFLVAFLSSQMMRHKSFLSEILPEKNIMLLLLLMPLHIANFEKCLITLVAL